MGRINLPGLSDGWGRGQENSTNEEYELFHGTKPPARHGDGTLCGVEYDAAQAVVAALAAFFAAGFAAAGLVALATLAAVFRCSDVCVPNFLLNRSTRPSVSISFCRPVKNG